MAGGGAGGKLKAWSSGQAFYGASSLGLTLREGSAKQPRRRPQGAWPQQQPASQPQPAEQLPAGFPDIQESEQRRPPHRAELGPGFTEAAVERSQRLVELLRRADVKLPAGVPAGGQVLSEDNALLFVARFAQMLLERGAEEATPRVAFHWTAEANFQSISESNLRTPDGAGVKKKHGAAFGQGVYMSPDFLFGQEDFSYGTSSTFMCLVLTGKQETRVHGARINRQPISEGCDSVTGRFPGRGAEVWVFPESEQLLPCFLVDQLALPAAREALHAAVQLLREPWPPGVLERAPGAAGLGEAARAPAADAQGVEPRGGREARETGPQGLEAAAADPGKPSHTGRLVGEVVPATTAAESGAPGSQSSGSRWNRRNQSFYPALGATAGEAEGLGEPCAHGSAQPVQAWPEPTAGEGEVEAAEKAEEVEQRGVAAQEAAGALPRARWRVSGRKEGGAGTQRSAAEGPDSLESSSGGQVVTVAASLLDAEETLIVHQCCCVLSRQAEGVAAAVFERWPAADIYRERRERGRPLDRPGRLSVHGKVVNLFSQFCPGRALEHRGQVQKSMYAECFARFPGIADTREERLAWFQEGLERVPSVTPEDAPRCMALPARIGCGLAGGHWPTYLEVLRDFARRSGFLVAIYDHQAASGQRSAATGQVAFSLRDMRPKVASSCSGAREAAAIRPSGGRSSCSRSQCSSFWERAVLEQRAPDEVWEAWAPCSAEQQTATFAALRRSDGHSGEEVPAGRDGCQRACHLQVGPQDAVVVSTGAASSTRLLPGPVVPGEARLPQDLLEDATPTALSSCGRTLSGHTAAAAAATGASAEATCVVCMCAFSEEPAADVCMLACGHAFHQGCLAQWFASRPECPTCKRRFGTIVGQQPKAGTMAWELDRAPLPGHAGFHTWVLTFSFPRGVDPDGVAFHGRQEKAYLPDSPSGRLILAMFELAFRRCVMFGLGISMERGIRRPTFNVHLKTSRSGGAAGHGFPDEAYLGRAVEELRDSGITVDQIR